MTLLLLLATSGSLHAQERMRTERLTTEEGLSQSMVYTIVQDRKGFLWFGTRDGLNRYDGYGFTLFRHEPFDTTSLPWPEVTVLGEDREGNIWLSSGVGITKLDRRTYTFTHLVHSDRDPRTISSDAVTCVQGDGTGAVWIGTEHGLNRFDPRTRSFTRYFARRGDRASLGSDTISSLYLDRGGALWVGTAGGYLHRFDQSRNAFVRYDAGLLSAGEVICLGEDHRGNIYTGGASSWRTSSVACLDRNSGAVISRIMHPGRRYYRGECFVRPTCIDSLGGLWIEIRSWVSTGPARHGAEIHRIALSEKDADDPAWDIAPITGANVWRMICDRRGNVWAGTENGVVRVTPEKPRFTIYRSDSVDPHTLSSDRIRCIHRDRHGILWVGTDNGLNRLDEASGRWRRYLCDPRDPHSITSNAINTIGEEPDGTLMFGTNSGVALYERTRDRFLPRYSSSSGDGRRGPLQVWSFYRDGDGILWVGTRADGIVLFDRDGRLVRRFAPRADDPTTIDRGVVWDMHRDRAGRLWIATGGGLYRWMPERGIFKRYGKYPADPHGLSSENVCAIMEDSSGALWFTTYGGGLNRYDPRTDGFGHITTHAGLPSNVLYGALADGAGRLWISSNTGLAVYDPRSGSCRVYSVGNGLASNEFGFKAFARTDDGEMLFGGIRGVCRFHPDSLRRSTRSATMAVTEFRIFDAIVRHELAERDTVVIDHDQSFISFTFAALDYANPAGIRYAYRLEGFDDDWIYCGGRRYASFTNLDPGTYTFMVMGTNGDGIWSRSPLRIVVHVVPPFWMTWWFKASSVLLVVLIAAAATLLWLRSVRGREILRRRTVESQLQALRLHVNPHFIFNALSSIQYLILKKEGDLAAEYLTRFARLVRGVLENSDRMSIPLAEELESLRHYLHLESLRFKGCFCYGIEVDEAIDPDQVTVPTMLLQPYVENAIRHGLLHKSGGEGRLVIRIVRRGDLIRCMIEDDGIGRGGALLVGDEREGHRRSTGMRVTEERLNILNAASPHGEPINVSVTDLHGDDGAPAGTRVEIAFPVEYL